MAWTESNYLSSLLTATPTGDDPDNSTVATSLSLKNVALNLQDVIGAMILGLVFVGVLDTYSILSLIRLTAQAPSSPSCSKQLREIIKA